MLALEPLQTIDENELLPKDVIILKGEEEIWRKELKTVPEKPVEAFLNAMKKSLESDLKTRSNSKKPSFEEAVGNLTTPFFEETKKLHERDIKTLLQKTIQLWVAFLKLSIQFADIKNTRVINNSQGINNSQVKVTLEIRKSDLLKKAIIAGLEEIKIICPNIRREFKKCIDSQVFENDQTSFTTERPKKTRVF